VVGRESAAADIAQIKAAAPARTCPKQTIQRINPAPFTLSKPGKHLAKRGILRLTKLNAFNTVESEVNG
jgi:hypothetical protein